MRISLTVDKILIKNDAIQAKFKQIRQQLNQSYPISEDLEQIKTRTLDRIRDWINSNRNRPMGTYNQNFQRLRRFSSIENLYQTLKVGSSVVEEGEGRARLILGDYDFLNQFAPYWRVLNDGGYTPPAQFGYFLPGRVRPRKGVIRLAAFQKTGYPAGDGGRAWLLRATKPITPMRYISELQRIFESEIASYNFKPT